MEIRRTGSGEGEWEIDLLDILVVMWKRRWLMCGIIAAATAVMVVWSLLVRPVYQAETKIMVLQSGSSSAAAMMINQLGISPNSIGASSPSMRVPGEMCLEIINSRTVRDRIVDRFDLVKRFKVRSREQARGVLASRIVTKNNLRSGVVTIFVQDTDPKQASDMANALVDELRNMDNVLAFTEAAQRRVFYEGQMRSAKEGLARAEEEMKDFQEKTGIVKLDAQGDAAVQSISSMSAQIAAKEVQIRAMRKYYTEQNPDFRLAQEELAGMKDQLAKVEAGGGGGVAADRTGSMPAASAEYLRRARDLKFSEALYSLLVNQYQQAKLDEVRETWGIQVLDRAVPPETRIKPYRKGMALLGALIGLMAAVIVAGVLEYREGRERQRRPLAP